MKTAVEWLIDILKGQQDKPFNFEEWMIAMEHAKSIEKEQIINAYLLNHLQACWMKKTAKEYAEDYYNETFKSE